MVDGYGHRPYAISHQPLAMVPSHARAAISSPRLSCCPRSRADVQRALRRHGAARRARRERAPLRPLLGDGLDARLFTDLSRSSHLAIRNPQSPHVDGRVLRAHRGAVAPCRRPTAGAARRRPGRTPLDFSLRDLDPLGDRERPLPDRVLGQLRPEQLRADQHRRLGGRAAAGAARSREAAGRRVSRARLGLRRHDARRRGRRCPAPAGSSRATSSQQRAARGAHERRAAAARSRLPGAADRARLVRLQLHQVGRSHRARAGRSAGDDADAGVRGADASGHRALRRTIRRWRATSSRR